VAGAGAAGGFAIPWITGFVGDGAGVSTAVASLALWCVAMAGGAAALSRLPTPRREPRR
jgi:fucose permease